MEKESKNNEVYKIEIEIDNLNKEQYESIWAQLVDISGHSGKEITMKGGLTEPSDESSGLHKHGVIKSVCDDCTAYPFDERGKTPLCGTCKNNPLQTVL